MAQEYIQEQTVNKGNGIFGFQQPFASSVTRVPGFGQFVRSEASQNQFPNFQQMQNFGNPYGMNQQGAAGQNYNLGQPMQQDSFLFNQQQQQQNFDPCPCVAFNGNPCLCPQPMGQTQMQPSGGYLPQNILDQIRSCVSNTTPIFILPNNQPIPQQQPQQASQTPPQPQLNVGYPQTTGYYPSVGGIGWPPSVPSPIFPAPCFPYPFTLPVYDSLGNQNRTPPIGNPVNCSYCRTKGNLQQLKSEENDTHRCSPGNDDTVCTKPNCPSSINLQALASQFLSLQGVIPCAATRLVLRIVPGSNVTTTMEETMERAQKAIGALSRDQLIAETRNAQQVNGLINLHMVANPPRNIVPILTMLQLKVNSLKAFVENLVNRSITECQSIGAEGNTNLDPMILSIKSDAELRELLTVLRQRECEERVNVNYAPYHSQRVVAESRLRNFQNKISQVEAEMERRRASAMPWVNSPGNNGQNCSSGGGGNTLRNFQGCQSNGAQGFNQSFNASQTSENLGRGFDSPNPFMVQVQNPRRLNLKPNCGSPQTTYNPSLEGQNPASPEAFAVSKLENDVKGCRRDDGADNEAPSKESTDGNDQVSAEGKKKLKIRIDDKGDLSVSKQSLDELKTRESVELSADNVVIVIDKVQESESKKIDNKKTKMKQKKEKTSGKNRGRGKKSEESIPSDSTYDSGTSISSKSSVNEDDCDDTQRVRKQKSRSILKYASKGKKKTTINENVNPENLTQEDKASSIKKEKHINVAMLSKLFYNHSGINGEAASLLEDPSDLPIMMGTEDESRYHVSDNQNGLNILNESNNDKLETVQKSKLTTESKYIHSTPDADKNSLANNPASSQIRAPFEDRSNRSDAVRLKSNFGTSNSLLNKGTNVVTRRGTLREDRFKDNKENTVAYSNGEVCSILSKRNQGNRTLLGSISSMDKENRKSRNRRWK